LSVSLKCGICHQQEKLHLSWSLETEAEVLHCGSFPGKGSRLVTERWSVYLPLLSFRVFFLL
jgi:hypothetical protein